MQKISISNFQSIFIVASNVCFYYPSSQSGLKEKGQKSGTHVWEQVRIVFLVPSGLQNVKKKQKSIARGQRVQF
jgi:hypothetical protein